MCWLRDLKEAIEGEDAGWVDRRKMMKDREWNRNYDTKLAVGHKGSVWFRLDLTEDMRTSTLSRGTLGMSNTHKHSYRRAYAEAEEVRISLCGRHTTTYAHKTTATATKTGRAEFHKTKRKSSNKTTCFSSAQDIIGLSLRMHWEREFGVGVTLRGSPLRKDGSIHSIFGHFIGNGLDGKDKGVSVSSTDIVERGGLELSLLVDIHASPGIFCLGLWDGLKGAQDLGVSHSES